MAKKLTTTQINKLFKDTFDNDVGKKCLEHLGSVFVDRDIAQPGDDLLAIGIRQGQADVIKKIIREVYR